MAGQLVRLLPTFSLFANEREIPHFEPLQWHVISVLCTSHK